jgi:hypothetical protein
MTPPKTPRATTIVGRDRDARETTTPPAGSPAARALEEGAVPIRELEDLKTDPNATDYETLQRRAHRAAVHAQSAAISTEALRTEFKTDIRDQNLKIDSINTRVGAVDTKVEKMSGQVDIIVGMVKPFVEASMQLQHMKITKTLEVDAAQAMLPIEDRKMLREQAAEDRKARRANWALVLGTFFGAGGIIVLIVVAITNGKC